MSECSLSQDHFYVARVASVPTINPSVQQAGKVQLRTSSQPSSHSLFGKLVAVNKPSVPSIACWSSFSCSPPFKCQSERSIKAREAGGIGSPVAE